MTLLRTFVTVVSPLGECLDLKVKLVYRNRRCLILGVLWRGLKEIYASPAAKKINLSLDLACGAPDSILSLNIMQFVLEKTHQNTSNFRHFAR